MPNLMFSTQPHIDAPASTPRSGSGDSESDAWLSRARQAYDQSTNWTDSNYRRTWEDALNAFNSRHAGDSKYHNSLYEKRSRIYRPKTRSVIRKNEAAAAAAFFSNMEVVEARPENEGDKRARASAAIMKQLLQYRLVKSIPWYQVCLGALQDGQTIGAIVSRQYWDYTTRTETIASTDGLPEVKVRKVMRDRPTVKLIPIENFRVDPAAAWDNVIESSPYLIELMPMYVGDIKARMRQRDDKTSEPEWRSHPDSVIRSASAPHDDSTRMSRLPNRQDPMSNADREIGDYEIAWVQRHIHRREGRDWEFYTLGTEAMLSTPQLLSETSLIGRDYVLGCVILETHKVYKTGVPELVKQIQDESNEVANQRLDNVKFVLNKRWIVKRGKNVDLNSLLRNVPGAVTLADDVEADVKEVTWPDVTASAYAEQDRLNVDFDDLVGNFSAGSVASNRSLNETVGGLQMLGSGASMMTEYLIRTFSVTWAEPVLRQVVLLEQKYETDQTILALAGQKAELFQKFGIDQVTDDLLQHELSLRINIGMGATDPTTKLQKLIMALTSFINLAKAQVPGLNLAEVAKEIFSMVGYQDGQRFLTNDNPQVAQLTQQLQQLQAQLQQIMLENERLKNDNSYKKVDSAARMAEVQIKAAESGAGKEDPTAIHARKMAELAMNEQHQSARNVSDIRNKQAATAATIRLKQESVSQDIRLRRETAAANLALKAQAQAAAQRLAERQAANKPKEDSPK